MSIEAMNQALNALNTAKPACFAENTITAIDNAITALRQAIEQAEKQERKSREDDDMPKQYVMIGRFMLQPHQLNGYWLSDTGTAEAMQVFQPEMERIIKELWAQL